MQMAKLQVKTFPARSAPILVDVMFCRAAVEYQVSVTLVTKHESDAGYADTL